MKIPEVLNATSDNIAGDADDVRTRIADAIEALSRTQVAPKGKGCPKVIAKIDAGEISFDSYVWLLRFLQVQKWLCFSENITLKLAETKPDEAVKKLQRLLKAKGVTRNVDGLVLLSQDGEEKLASRLERAVERQVKFENAIEEDITLAKATTAWLDEWDADPDEEISIRPITASVTTWRIEQVKSMAATKSLTLSPTYQRGDVWATTDAQTLIISILKGIPLPSIIVLETDNGQKCDIVDGKQRLTSILRFIGQYPDAVDYVKSVDEENRLDGKLLSAFHSDHPLFRRMWKELGKPLSKDDDATRYFPFPLPRNMGPEFYWCAGKYYSEIRGQVLVVAGYQTTVQGIFEGSMTKYLLPMIVYTAVSPDQIHHVFELYNRLGKHLNQEEIRNAVYHEVPLARMLLAASGDNTSYDKLLSFFANPVAKGQIKDDGRESARRIASALENYRFGTGRYRRTKVLGWLCSIILAPNIIVNDDGTTRLIVRSTSKQINELFETAKLSPRETMLGNPVTLRVLLDDLDVTLNAHSSNDGVWHKDFKGADNFSWQELPLVASLVATFLVHVETNRADDVIESKENELEDYTEKRSRLGKQQTKSQWAWIGMTIDELLNVMEVDRTQLGRKLTERYGVNCLPAITAARELASELAKEEEDD